MGTVPGPAPQLPGVNPVRPPLQAPPPPPLGRQPAVGIPRGHPPAPARGGCGQQNYGRGRGRGRWGRKNTRSYPRGPRGGYESPSRPSSPCTPPDVPPVSSWTPVTVSPTVSPSTRVMLSPTLLSVLTWLAVSSPTT